MQHLHCPREGQNAAPWLLATGKLPDVNSYNWELYHIAEDYSEYNDLASKMPAKLKEMQALFLTEDDSAHDPVPHGDR